MIDYKDDIIQGQGNTDEIWRKVKQDDLVDACVERTNIVC